MSNTLEDVKNKLSVSSMTGVDTQGSHPIHGSTGKMNFSVNDRENSWYCFRHSAGGSSLEWIAVQDFHADCSQAKDYVDNNFTEVLKRGCEITGIKYQTTRKPKMIFSSPVDPKAYSFNFVPLLGKSKKAPGFPSSWRQYQTTKYELPIEKGQNRFITTGTYDLNISPLIVVDLDPNETADFDLEKFYEEIKLPRTLTVQTPSGGYHLYYLIRKVKSYEDIPRSMAITITDEIIERNPYLKGLRGIDIQSQGKLVYAPPTAWTEGDKLGKYTVVGGYWLKELHSNFLYKFDYTEEPIKEETELTIKQIIFMTSQHLEDSREFRPQFKVRKFEEIFYFDKDKGVFRIDDENVFLRSKVVRYIRELKAFDIIETKHIKEIVNKHKESLLMHEIKKLDDFYKRSKLIDKDTIMYCTNDGLITQNIRSGEITKSDYDYRELFMSRLNFTLREEPNPKYWVDRLSEAIPNKEDLDLTLLFLAYTLIPDFTWKASLFLHGPSNSGKSTLIRNYIKIFDNVVRTKLSDLKLDLFSLQELREADIWLINEINKQYFEDEMWKNVIEGFEIAIRVMRLGRVNKKVDFKTIHTANRIPTTSDEATMTRLLPIKVPNRFDRDKTNEINDLLQEHLDDFISWLIIEKVPEYFRRIKELTKLQKNRTLEYYKMNERPFIRFSLEEITVDGTESGSYTSEEIAEIYNGWAITEGFDKLTTRRVGVQINKMIKEGIGPYQEQKRENNKRYWTGFIIKYNPTKEYQTKLDFSSE